MSTNEAWRQAIARAEVLLQEGEAAEDIPLIADAVSGFTLHSGWRRARRCRSTGPRRKAG